MVTIFGIIPSHQRAMGLAFLGLCIGLISSFGPAVVGGISDLLTARFGAAGLRYTLAGGSCFMIWTTIHLFIGVRSVATDYVGGTVDVLDAALAKPAVFPR